MAIKAKNPTPVDQRRRPSRTKESIKGKETTSETKHFEEKAETTTKPFRRTHNRKEQSRPENLAARFVLTIPSEVKDFPILRSSDIKSLQEMAHSKDPVKVDVELCCGY